MTEVINRPTAGRVDADLLVRRIDALGRFLAAGEGRVPDNRLVPVHTVVERAGQRLSLSRDHTVVALAGSTGSGKSSLFNALARMNLSPVGVRRPTTGVTYACVWGPVEGAAGLLDWLGVLPRHRFTRESELDGDREAGLRGLVLLDLPDFDSIDVSHRAEVDRLLGLVDLVVWVVDPQKYADKLVHESYLRQFHQHRDVTVVALNHADRLDPADVQRCLTDLRRLLDVDGLPGVATLASSAYGPPGYGELRAVLERAVAERQASLRRLSGDVDRVTAELSTLVGPAVSGDLVDRTTVRILTDALAHAAGVSAVVHAAEQAYRHRAKRRMGWPVLRWLRRLRPDPLKRLHLRSTAENPGPVAATSLPEPTPAQRAAVGLAVRAVADRAADSLPAPWPAVLATAARSRADDLPDALDRAVAGTDLGLSRSPAWWTLVSGIQWLATLGALAGLAWLAVGWGLAALGLPLPDYPKVGIVPVPTLLLLGGILLGLLIAGLSRPLVAFSARRAASRALSRLRAAVGEVAREYVLMPVRTALQAYADARDALAIASGERTRR